MPSVSRRWAIVAAAQAAAVCPAGATAASIAVSVEEDQAMRVWEDWRIADRLDAEAYVEADRAWLRGRPGCPKAAALLAHSERLAAERRELERRLAELPGAGPMAVAVRLHAAALINGGFSDDDCMEAMLRGIAMACLPALPQHLRDDLLAAMEPPPPLAAPSEGEVA